MGRKRRITIGHLVHNFLVSISTHSAESTVMWYANYLRPFAARHAELPVHKLTCSQVYAWIDRQYKGKAGRHNAARCVVRLCNWAVQEQLLDRSPLTGFRKPAPQHRETVVTPAQYANLLRIAKPRVKDVVKFLWHTGARPQEMRAIKSNWVQGNKIVFPQTHSKSGTRRRVIYLDNMAARICYRLSHQHNGRIFKNTRGVPWTEKSLATAMARLGRAAGVPNLCAYSIRHTWITRQLEKGTDVATVAALAGNSPQMVLKVYNHVVANEERLLRCVW